MTCQECVYYAESEGRAEHCCFNEWGHADYELAPCDDPEYEDAPEVVDEFGY